MKLPQPINSLVHFGVGVWVGSTVNDPKFRHGGYVTGAAFLAYQVTEAWRKGDEAYGEIKEFATGIAVGLLVYRLRHSRLFRKPEDT